MITIERILCPVDFSPFSFHALQHAVQLARWFASSLTVLYVYPTPATPPSVLYGGLPGPLPSEPYPGLTVSPERVREDLIAELTKFGAAIDASGVDIRFDVRTGAAVSGILDEAAAQHTGLIVMGTHGHSGFDRWVLGSVTEKTLRKAPCPVLTVPPPVVDAPREPLQLFRRILCAVDFSDASLKGLEYAVLLAKEADAELLLVHVIEGLPDAPHWQQPPSPAVVEYLRFSEDNAIKRLGAAIPHDAAVWCRPHTVLATGKPYAEILRVAREQDVSLIVMGVHGRNPIDLMLFGSTTQHVVRAATCPVLTLKG